MCRAKLAIFFSYEMLETQQMWKFCADEVFGLLASSLKALESSGMRKLVGRAASQTSIRR